MKVLANHDFTHTWDTITSFDQISSVEVKQMLFETPAILRRTRRTVSKSSSHPASFEAGSCIHVGVDKNLFFLV
jgi:hypothetical protein